jgi:hypothetical protein
MSHPDDLALISISGKSRFLRGPRRGPFAELLLLTAYFAVHFTGEPGVSRPWNVDGADQISRGWRHETSSSLRLAIEFGEELVDGGGDGIDVGLEGEVAGV